MLKGFSFIHHSSILERQQHELPDHMPEPIQIHTAVPCWERQKFPTIPTYVPDIDRKAAQSDPVRRFVTLEHRSANCPVKEWTQVYIDGSAIDATRDGGAGVYTKYRAEEAHISVAAGRYSTNFKAEAMTLNTAVTEILANLDKTHKEVVFFSDAVSVLVTPQNPQTKEINNLTSIMSQPSQYVLLHNTPKRKR